MRKPKQEKKHVDKKTGELSPTSSPSVQSHFGTGRGKSMAGSLSRKEEIARLRQQTDELRKQMESIDLRLRKFKDNRE